MDRWEQSESRPHSATRGHVFCPALALLLLCAAGERPPPEPPTHYSCRIETELFRGRSTSTLRRAEKRIERVWHQGKAYRIETTIQRYPPGTASGRIKPSAPLRKIRLNNGDGSDTEFEYWPDRKRAGLSLACVQTLFSRTYPERWKREFGGHPVRLSGNLLLTEDLTGSARKLPNVSVWKLAPRQEKIDGKECVVLFHMWNGLLDQAGSVKVDPTTRYTTRRWVWVKGNVVLREEMVAEDLGDEPPRPLVLRSVKVVHDLKLNPSLPASLFELPPGTVCTVFDDYPTRLPKGVIPRVIPGPGLSIER